MVKTILTILLACALGPSGSLRPSSSGHEWVLDQANVQVESRLIDQTTALQIARKHAEQSYGSLEGYNTLACEQGLLWRVFFEPATTTSDFSALEYVISKAGGKILRQRKMPLAGQNHQDFSPTAKVDRRQAIAIARKDSRKAYRSLTMYQVVVCELSSAWVVVFSPEAKLDGGGPEYVISKRTGDILDKRYYQ